MNIDQLNQYGKKIGLKHLGSLTKSQMVFEIVKAISENPNEVLYGEGVLEILPMVLASSVPPTITIFLLQKIFMSLLLKFAVLTLKKGDTLSGTIRPPKG